LFKGFVAGDILKTLERPNIPDAAPARIYLFLRLKSALKGRRFCDATDTIKNATVELKSFQKRLPGIFPSPLL
jgi:hypothetical protein